MMFRASPGARGARKSDNDSFLIRQVLHGFQSLQSLPSTLMREAKAILARRDRQYTRTAKRLTKHHFYMGHGLNGPRAMARRRRQIAAGSLREANGLVLS